MQQKLASISNDAMQKGRIKYQYDSYKRRRIGRKGDKIDTRRTREENSLNFRTTKNLTDGISGAKQNSAR